MNENTLKHELLKQNGKSAVDEEVGRLTRSSRPRARVRRLAWWTIGVWAVWFLMISLSLVVPMLAYHAASAPARR